MKKQEVIQQSYCEYWDQVKTHVREDGTIHERHLTDSTGHLGDCIELERVYGVFYRPKSLSGIDHNNGWIKIERKSDLPKERVNCWIMDKESGLICGEFLNNSKEECNFWLANATHYQPLVEPKLPIY